MKSKNIFSALALVFFLVLVTPVQAIEYGMLGGKPAYPDPSVENSNSWFMYNLKPGEMKEDALQVMNLFEEDLEVVVYAADTIKSSSGGFALRQFMEANQEVGNWVKFYPDEVPQSLQSVFEAKDKKIIEFCRVSKEDLEKELGKKDFSEDVYLEFQNWCQGKSAVERKFAAKEKMIIPFVFAVPEGIDVGEHTGGILIQKKAIDDVDANQGSSVKLTTRVGVRIYETVPGEIIKKISIEDFRIVKNFSEFSFADWFGELKKPKEYLVETVIRNDGNVSIEHENNLVIKNILSGKTENIERKFQALKGDKFVANFTWNKPLFGYYSFQAQVKYQNGDENAVLSATPVSLVVIPWREIVLLLSFFALVATAYILWKRAYQKKYGGVGWVEYTVKKTDTVAKLSEKCQIDWKVLVRTNKIKAPYLLESGRSILIPPVLGKGDARPEAVKKDSKLDIVAKPVKKTEAKKMVDKKVKSKAVVKMTRKKKEQPQIETMSGWLDGKNSVRIVLAIAIVTIVLSGIIAVVINNRADEKRTAEEKISLVSALQSDKAVEKTADKVEVAEKNEKAIDEPVKKDIQKTNIVILNGGAVAGSAGKLKDILIGKGYLNVETKNAEKDNHQGQVVYYQKESQAVAVEIQKILQVSYPDISVKEGVKDEEKSQDVVIMLGK